jgi:hypothetical protein
MKTMESGWRQPALAALLLSAMGPSQAKAQSTNLLSGGDTVFVSYDNGTSGPEAGEILSARHAGGPRFHGLPSIPGLAAICAG